MKNLLLLFAVLSVFFSSCTIEKRRYTDGYHVEWHRNHDGAHVNLQKSVESKSVVVENETVAESTPAARPITEKASSDVLTNQATSPSLSTNSIPEVSKLESSVLNETKTPTAGAAGRKSLGKSMQIGTWASQGSLNIISEQNQSNDVDTLVLIIIAIFISPLAVYLHQGSWNTACWINLILWLLFVLPGFIHALIVILG